jgi:DNA sulfur modification protein DndD
MLLRRIVLENFGVFRDRNELDLTPQIRYRKRRPVILIGGKNGSGKTTLLEALRLCLYGQMALGSRVGVREYEAYLADRIHRAEGGDLYQAGSAAVGMEFEYAQAGIRHTYWVERRWEKLEGSMRNVLTIQRDGKPLDELDRAHADEFLRDLIPPGVSQLFFFDGEKIQELADSEQDHIALAEATRGLIGLELLERLQGDLRVYSGKLKDSPNADSLEDEWTTLKQERAVSEQRRRELVLQQDECQSRHDRIKQDAAREEQRLTRTGGVFANQRETLLAEKEQLLKSIADAEAELRELSEGLLPLTLATGLCRLLKDQLENEAKILAWNTQHVAITDRLAVIKTGIDKALNAGLEQAQLSSENRSQLSKMVGDLLDQLAEPPDDLPEVPLIHKQSDDGQKRILSAIDRIIEEVPRQLTAVQKRLERSIRRLRDVETALEKIPLDEVIQPVLERIRELDRELGAAQAGVHQAEVALREIDLKLIEIARREKKLQEKSAKLQKASSRGALVVKVQAALEDYAQTLTSSKIHDLRDAVVRCFTELWRKGDLVRRIEIDPQSFRVTLFDRHDRVVPKHQLSAGEKQIYAISMLWALGQLSGRPLPMVIDTPLGRLDSDHRGHLVERYFPQASHQVIILSTDTEIDQAFFKALGPSISHSYNLQFNAAEGCCLIDEGYFWSDRDAEVIHAGE